MVRITVELLRKRAEHNNCEVLTLEEISLHQQEIERIEYLDKVCRDLKILYLQSNLIPKIENVGRLKKLEYLNLALNNITIIENLEGCEFLKKLDFTVNFVAELTSVETLTSNYHLRELFLTGNPCTDYEGYRQYVIGALDQLQWLDGKEIEKSERILAKQDHEAIRANIIRQQEDLERKKTEEKGKEKEKQKTERKKGSDGTWYTDIKGSDKEKTPAEDEADEKRYWQEVDEYTPESRTQMHKHIEERRREREEKDQERLGKKQHQREVRYFADDGRVRNINQGKWEFVLTDDEENNQFVLDLHCYRHLDTSLIDADVQPNYIRVTIKDKVFQLALSEEVHTDASNAKRSQTTGHLLVSMPKVKQVLKPLKTLNQAKDGTVTKTEKRTTQDKEESKSNDRFKSERLEVNPKLSTGMDFSNIVEDVKHKSLNLKQKVEEVSEESEDFIDDPDVPPLM